MQYKTIEPCPKCGEGMVIVTWERDLDADSPGIDAQPVSGRGCRNHDCEWFDATADSR